MTPVIEALKPYGKNLSATELAEGANNLIRFVEILARVDQRLRSNYGEEKPQEIHESRNTRKSVNKRAGRRALD